MLGVRLGSPIIWGGRWRSPIAGARDIEVRLYDAKTAEARAAVLLAERADEILRPPLGPPWTKDHRTALAATVLAGI